MIADLQMRTSDIYSVCCLIHMFALFGRIISVNRIVLEMGKQWCAQSLERDSSGDRPLDKLYQHKTGNCNFVSEMFLI